jgi:hypothetical protein
MSIVLTNHPHIVIARPPRRIRKPAKPAGVIVGRKVAPDPPPGKRDDAPVEATDRLWGELVGREAN